MYVATERKDKASEKELNKIEISNLSEKEFKIMIIQMITELERKGETDDHSENFNRVRKYKKEAIRADEYNN